MSITGTPDGEPVKVGVPVVRPGLRALHGARGHRGTARAGHAPARASTSTSRCSSPPCPSPCGRPAATSRPARSAARSARRTRAQAPYQAFRTADGWATLGAITPRTWAGPVRRARSGATCETTSGSSTRPPGTPAARSSPRSSRSAPTHADDRRADRAARGGRRAVRADRRLRAGVHRRAPRGARLLLGRRRTPSPGRCARSGSPMRFSRTPVERAGAGPVLGADTRAALRESRATVTPRSTPWSRPGRPGRRR